MVKDRVVNLRVAVKPLDLNSASIAVGYRMDEKAALGNVNRAHGA
jgi:hypothetical protein